MAHRGPLISKSFPSRMYFLGHSIQIIFNLMFPVSNDLPAIRGEQGADLRVTLPVALELGVPVAGV